MNPLETEQLIYDFALYIYPILNNWPKAEKFALTNRIKNCIFTMLEECVALRKSSTKKSHADAYGIVRKIWAEALAAKAARESANKDSEAYDGARDSPRSA